MSVRLAIFTICSNNYVPFARTFVDTVRRHHPEAALFVCLTDRKTDIPGFYDSDWTVVEAESLDIPEFSSFAFRYDIAELNTAVKPFMFQRLLEDLDYDIVLYFDPDIEIFRPLETVVELLCDGASFLLTPHLLSPSESPDEPNDLTIMRAGTYNLGFLAVSRCEESQRIIEWWARRLRFQCISAQDKGIFVDQKFMDLVPGFASRAVILRDVTLNVAYWNLRQRQLEERDGTWLVDGQPLGFFHYSGYDPSKRARLSKYDTNLDGKMPEPLWRLTNGYADRLVANGHGTVPLSSYAYGRFASGTPIHPLVRKMFREWHAIWYDDPFTSYESYLDQPWPGAVRDPNGGFVTNFMKFLHDTFPALSMHLDLQQPTHVRELVNWFVRHAHCDLRIDLALVEPTAARVGARRGRAAMCLARGAAGAEVTVVGYLRTASGVGEVGRQTLQGLAEYGMAAEGLDVALNVVADRNDESCARLLCEAGSAQVQIFNVNADQLALVVRQTSKHLRHPAIRINIPFWELSSYPDAWLQNFAAMDEIWAPSRFIQCALAGRIDKRVLHMPVAIELPPIINLPRSRFGLPDDRFLFFYAFDFLSFMQRKNPRAAIRAFRIAFPQSGKAGLVLKSMNGWCVPDQLTALREAIDGHPDIFLLDETLSRADTLGLIASMNAVLSLHRSEGLGLLVAEAMILEKPVIATDYSATREFLSEETGYPVGYELVPVGEGEYAFSEGQIWADADVAQAAWLMRYLHEDTGRAASKLARARAHLQQNYSRAFVAELQVQRLRALAPSLHAAS